MLLVQIVYVSAKFLIETSDVLAAMQTVIFQASLDMGNIPNDWKETNIASVFKKGSQNEPSNYHLISLTSITCKMMERVIIMSHLGK